MSKLTSMLIIVTVIGVSGGLTFLLIRNFLTKMVQQSLSKSVQIDEIDLSNIQRQCAKSPNVPAGGYAGLLTDVHVHTMLQYDQGAFAEKLLQEMNETGVDRVAVQPNHSPQGVGRKEQRLDEAWGKIARTCNRLIYLVYGFNPNEADAWEYVQEKLATGHYGGVGEIEFQHGGFTNLRHDPQSLSMVKIYNLLEKHHLPIHFQATLNIDQSLSNKLYKIVSGHPQISFVWFSSSAEDQFLTLPNLYYDLFVHRDSRVLVGNDPRLQKGVIGSDAGPAGFWNPAYGLLPYNSFAEAMHEARRELVKLPSDVADALAHDNFNRVWPKK